MRCMIEIFDRIVAHLNSSDKRERLKLFSIHHTRCEGWVKGELIWLFEELKKKHIVDCFEVEAENKIDFFLWKEQKKILIELKAMSIDKKRSLSFYYSKNQIGKDFRKLHNKQRGEKNVLVVAYPCTFEQWKTQVGRVKTKYPWTCCDKCVESPLDSERMYTIAMWKVT